MERWYITARLPSGDSITVGSGRPAWWRITFWDRRVHQPVEGVAADVDLAVAAACAAAEGLVDTAELDVPLTEWAAVALDYRRAPFPKPAWT